MTAAERIMALFTPVEGQPATYGHGHTVQYIANELMIPETSVRRVFGELKRAGKLVRNPVAKALIIPVQQ